MTWPAYGSSSGAAPVPPPPPPRPARGRQVLTGGLVVLGTAAALVLASLVLMFVDRAPAIPSSPPTPVATLTGPAVLPSGAATNG
jgi:hypothetical protein